MGGKGAFASTMLVEGLVLCLGIDAMESFRRLGTSGGSSLVKFDVSLRGNEKVFLCCKTERHGQYYL